MASNMGYVGMLSWPTESTEDSRHLGLTRANSGQLRGNPEEVVGKPTVACPWLQSWLQHQIKLRPTAFGTWPRRTLQPCGVLFVKGGGLKEPGAKVRPRRQ